MTSELLASSSAGSSRQRISVPITGPTPLLISVHSIKLNEAEEPVPVDKSFCKRIRHNYNRWVLFALGMQYFNTGMRSMIVLSLNDLFLYKYRVSPVIASMWISFVNLPWAPKLFYGILCDSLPICGSTKRSYCLLMGLIQAATLLSVAAVDWAQP